MTTLLITGLIHHLSPSSPWQMISKSEGRVAVAGTVLALVQSVGFIISLYLLVSSYTDEGRYDDPRSHVCVEALLCLMYR